MLEHVAASHAEVGGLQAKLLCFKEGGKLWLELDQSFLFSFLDSQVFDYTELVILEGSHSYILSCNIPHPLHQPMPANTGEVGSNPGSRRSPGERNDNSLHYYSCLGISMDRGAWRATVHRVTKRQT